MANRTWRPALASSAVLVLLAALAAPVRGQPVGIFPPSPPLGWNPGLLGTFGGNLLVASFMRSLEVVDPTDGSVVQTFVNPGGAFNNDFGASFAVVGPNVLVGDPKYLQTSMAPLAYAGIAYLFDGTTGDVLLTLSNPDVPTEGAFGTAVAAFGSDLLVGAARNVYLIDGTTGTILRTFPNPTPTSAKLFGGAVATMGTNVLVGTPRDMTDGVAIGKAHLFDGTTGALLQTFSYPNPPAFGTLLFGQWVGVLGSDVLVAAIDGVRLFDPTTGTLLRTFALPPPRSGPFGSAFVTPTGNLLVGFQATPFGGLVGGAVALFDGVTAAPIRTIDSPAPGTPVYGYDSFGTGVAIAGGVIAVSGHRYLGGSDHGGTVYRYCGEDTGCGPCETCSPAGTCVLAPDPGCRPTSEPGSALLKLVHGTRDRITWKWKGSGLDVTDFGQPPLTHDYTLCVYDESGPTPSLLFRATAPAGEHCVGASCWASFPQVGAYTFRQKQHAPEGISSVRLQAFAAKGTAKIILGGSGPNLDGRPFGFPTLPPPLPLRVQIQGTDARCWEATYSAATKSTPTTFKANSD